MLHLLFTIAMECYIGKHSFIRHILSEPLFCTNEGIILGVGIYQGRKTTSVHMKFIVLCKETKMNQMNKLSSILEYNCYEGGRQEDQEYSCGTGQGGQWGKAAASEKERSE